MAGRTIVLAGNPQVGKSTLFFHLAGSRVVPPRAAGSAPEVWQSCVGSDRLLDTPGIYGLGRSSEEERVALAAIREADLVVHVVDGTHLPRDLFLTEHLLDAGVPVVVAVNMMDELRRRQGAVDTAYLEEALAVPVVPVSGLTGEGVSVLRAIINRAPQRFSPRAASQLDELLWREEDRQSAERLGRVPAAGSRAGLYRARRERAEAVTERAFQPPLPLSGLSRWIHSMLLTRWGALGAIALVLALGYTLVGGVVAGTVVPFLEGLMHAAWTLGVASMSPVFPPGSGVYPMLIGPYGMLSVALLDIAAILVPLTVAVLLGWTILEDSGFLARLAVVADSPFVRVGGIGRVLPPGIWGRENLAGHAPSRSPWMSGVLVPLGIVPGLLAGLGASYLVSYALALAALAGLYAPSSRTRQRAPTAPLVVDVPPLRWPMPHVVLEKTRINLERFIKTAGLRLLGVSMGLEAAQVIGLLPWLDRRLNPLMEHALGMPGASLPALILGLVHPAFGVAALYGGGAAPHQLVTAAVFLVAMVPGFSMAQAAGRERGRAHGLVRGAAALVMALLCGALMARLGPR